MARINLLPWREELRRERQKQFMIAILMTFVVGVALVFLVGLGFDQRIDHQEARNQALRKEINSLQTRIKRIEQLEQTRERLLSRKRVIEELQASRSLTVELMDKLAKSIPVGITLDAVRQQGMNLTLTGFSQSNARVSAYLQSLDASDLFLDPQLGVVQSSNRPMTPIEPYEFTIGVKLRPVVKEDDADFDEFLDEGGAD
jgi:type IV pilus assembly protein PilN